MRPWMLQDKSTPDVSAHRREEKTQKGKQTDSGPELTRVTTRHQPINLASPLKCGGSKQDVIEIYKLWGGRDPAAPA